MLLDIFNTQNEYICWNKHSESSESVTKMMLKEQNIA